jgi:hypothetical protein
LAKHLAILAKQLASAAGNLGRPSLRKPQIPGTKKPPTEVATAGFVTGAGGDSDKLGSEINHCAATLLIVADVSALTG